jgi:hypothetical protein
LAKDYGVIKRGFKPLLAHCEKNSFFIASCQSCAYYYSVGDEPEECHNLGVLAYDMCTREDGTEYCCYWKSMGMRAKEFGLGK